MRIACSTAAFSQDRLTTAIAKIGWAGFRGIELELYREPYPPGDEARERLWANDLPLVGARAGALPPLAGETELAELARIGRAAALVRALDGPLIVLGAPGDGSLADLAGTLALLDTALGGLGVHVCLVNGRGTLLADPDAARALWALDLPERVGLALDPAEAHLCGWDPAELDTLPALPRHVYLSDTRGGRPAIPGEGELDPERLGEALRLRGYAGAVTVCLEGAVPYEVEARARELYQAAALWLGSSAL